MVLCGSLERMESVWGNGCAGPESDAKTGWGMECYMAAAVGEGDSAFFQPRMGVSAPEIEVYIACCCGGVPVILTKTILVSPKRKLSRLMMLDAIPENEELEKEQNGVAANGTMTRKVQTSEPDSSDDLEYDEKVATRYYPEDVYYGEGGQLSWFNAGVRVGVGIGLGMCLGVGIGVGLLMHSYQATTRNFRRRFF